MRSRPTTSSISAIERSWPTASGVAESGKTTISFSGSTGSVSGISTLSRSAASSVSNSTSVTADPPELSGFDRSFQTASRAKPAWPEDGIASDASFLSVDLDGHLLRFRGGLGDRHDDGQEAAGIASLRLGEFGVLWKADGALEGAVLDLHLLVHAPAFLAVLADALARDDQRPVGGRHVELLRVDARDVHEHRERGRIRGPEAAELRPEAAAHAREARHLPEVREQLVDLVDQISSPSHRVRES